MKYLLDTCVISGLTKPQPNGQVKAWLQETQSDDLFLSVVTIGEIKKGIYKLPASNKKQALLLDYLAITNTGHYLLTERLWKTGAP